MSEAAAPAEGAKEEAPKKKLDLFTLVALLNTVAVLATAGLLFYTKMVFKRPPITEAEERARLEAIKKKKAADAKPTVAGMVNFEPVTVNIRTTPGLARTTETGQVEGKLHYATIGFSLELKDGSKAPMIEELKPMFMDKLMSLLGRKTYAELTTVQGRFLVRSQIMDAINETIALNQAEQAAARAAKKKKEAAEKEAKEPASEKEKAPAPAEEETDRTAEVRDVMVTNVYFTQFLVQ